MSSEIPSTGSLGIDIAIALVTGGVVTTWLSLLFDRLSKRREEYIQITREKISKIANSEKLYMQTASDLSRISNLLKRKRESMKEKPYWQEKDWKERDYQECIYYISKYLHKIQRIVDEVGFIQLDNLYSEAVIQDLYQYLQLRLRDEPIGLENIAALREEFKEELSFGAFVSQLSTYHKKNVYNIYKEGLKRLDATNKMQDIIDRGYWSHELMSLELNLTYRIFYGDRHVKNYYREDCLPLDLLKYLEVNYPQYYRRLENLRLI